jgi:SAM-dependent methyltransferase
VNNRIFLRLARILEWTPWIWSFRWRFWKYVRIRKALRTASSRDSFEVTVDHNLKSIAARNDRMLRLIGPLAAIESLGRDARILVIGPRNEWDLMLLAKHGYRNVVGLDLISYSPLVELGDMHELASALPSDHFDAVLCGWTLSYSATPETVARQIIEVVKDGGFVGVAVEYGLDDPALDEAWQRADGYVIQDRSRLPRRVNSVDALLELFGPAVDRVFWNHDAPAKRHHAPGRLIPDPSAVCTVFSVRKARVP